MTYVSTRRAVERVDEAASGAVRHKLRFEQSIERVPETFSSTSRHTSNRLIGIGDCAVIAVADRRGENTILLLLRQLSDAIAQEDGGIRMVDFQSYLDGIGATHTRLLRVVIRLKICGTLILLLWEMPALSWLLVRVTA